MNKIIKEATTQIAILEKMLRIIELFQESEPIGCLKQQRKDKYTYFYHQYTDTNTKEVNKVFINKSNIALIRTLAQKQYYSAMKSLIDKELKVLKHLVKNYHPQKREAVYESLSAERRGFITTIPGSKEDRIRKWNELHGRMRKDEEKDVQSGNINSDILQEPSKYDFYPEGKKYTTEQGELVRSKSEVIIANILYGYKDDLVYVYECPLNLRASGKIITIHPDFKIMNVHTGKITYWEHAGMLDDASYANDFVKKINTYASNNLLIGRDVIFTCETLEIPLDTNVIKKIVEDLL